MVSFRVGAEDASLLAKELQPDFDVQDLLNLPNFRIYLKLMIDGALSKISLMKRTTNASLEPLPYSAR